MLLAASFPELRGEAVALTNQVREVDNIMDNIRDERGKLQLEQTRLEDARRQLVALEAIKLQSLGERKRALRDTRQSGNGLEVRLSWLSWQLNEGGVPRERGELPNDAFKAAQSASPSTSGHALAKMAARVASGVGELANLVRQKQDLQAAFEQLDETLLSSVALARDQSTIEGIVAKMNGIEDHIASLNEQVAAKFPAFAELSVDPAPMNLADIQALLTPDEALVFYYTAQDPPLVWAITREGVTWQQLNMARHILAYKISMLRSGLECPASTSDCSAPALRFDLGLAHELYRTLVVPVATAINTKRHLIVVPSGVLFGMPFQLLVTELTTAGSLPEKPDYRKAAWFGLQNAISVLPSVTSLRVLRQVAKRSRASKPYLGIGNPLLDGQQGDPRWGELHKQRALAARLKEACPKGSPPRTARIASRPVTGFEKLFRSGHADIEEIRRLIPLPETADELCEVARWLGVPESQVLLGARATETRIKDLSNRGELAQYAILHFATHGALTGQVEGSAEPGLILTPPPAGTNEPGYLDRDDGFLTASEIAELKLDADWVVLSACNTAGAADSTAEPLSGMVRAFFYAGARALLVSHWEVDSNAAVKLITRAFAELRVDPKIGRAEAMRRSMQEMIENGSPREAHPSIWGPFVVAGDGTAGR
jgi:CHAT domain-containing protein